MAETSTTRLEPGTQLGPHRITGSLGAGGMGEVYRARDTRLGRDVAIKVLAADLAADPVFRQRFAREARAVAALNHPNICTLHDVGQQGDLHFLVMECLEGETLADRIQREPLALPEALDHALVLLSTLDALHARGLVHRDIKPANVFLTEHGLKVLDFGLTREVVAAGDVHTTLTSAGGIVGSPHYMSPEALRGEALDTRTDIFSVGVVLYEMIVGVPPFQGGSLLEVAHAVLHDRPPVLGGSPAATAVDRIISRALAKDRDERYESASAMGRDVRDVSARAGAGTAASARRVTRLIVLPLRMLRPDDDIDFLAFSLPDAITSSLAGLSDSLVVRSSAAAARFVSAAPDLEALARDADVDVALTGTLLRAGDRLRVSAQLLDVPSGTVRWSHDAQVAMGDLFQVQDDLARRIVESVSVSLSADERARTSRHVPTSATAYEFYLRANEAGQTLDQWSTARDLYLRSLELDPDFAPAWARLGRTYRVLGKWVDPHRGVDNAESFRLAKQAFERALALDPDLPLAHNLLTPLQCELGDCTVALLRLLDRVRVAGGDPDLYAGLIFACRYAGLLDASMAAHARARRLDPTLKTSGQMTQYMAGNYDRLLEDVETEIDESLRVLCLWKLGRSDPAAVSRLATFTGGASMFARYARLLVALVGDDRSRALEAFREWSDPMLRPGMIADPEIRYHAAQFLVHFDQPDRALRLLRDAVAGGYLCARALRQDPWLDPLRGQPAFAEVLAEAERGHRQALAEFTVAEGHRRLGLPAA